ncbi:MAG: hypothetical protein HQL35_15760, partial [Alphaproteobacteria bacterium]|nr:hypothetical protein [Alphaproteobacteria bacterium]
QKIGEKIGGPFGSMIGNTIGGAVGNSIGNASPQSPKLGLDGIGRASSAAAGGWEVGSIGSLGTGSALAEVKPPKMPSFSNATEDAGSSYKLLTPGKPKNPAPKSLGNLMGGLEPQKPQTRPQPSVADQALKQLQSLPKPKSAPQVTPTMQNAMQQFAAQKRITVSPASPKPEQGRTFADAFMERNPIQGQTMEIKPNEPMAQGRNFILTTEMQASHQRMAEASSKTSDHAPMRKLLQQTLNDGDANSAAEVRAFLGTANEHQAGLGDKIGKGLDFSKTQPGPNAWNLLDRGDANAGSYGQAPLMGVTPIDPTPENGYSQDDQGNWYRNGQRVENPNRHPNMQLAGGELDGRFDANGVFHPNPPRVAPPPSPSKSNTQEMSFGELADYAQEKYGVKDLSKRIDDTFEKLGKPPYTTLTGDEAGLAFAEAMAIETLDEGGKMLSELPMGKRMIDDFKAAIEHHMDPSGKLTGDVMQKIADTWKQNYLGRNASASRRNNGKQPQAPASQANAPTGITNGKPSSRRVQDSSVISAGAKKLIKDWLKSEQDLARTERLRRQYLE